MENNIIRKYPTIKDERLYTDRYNIEGFEKYKEITKSIENYEKWKIGINYKTNRKIKVGGKTHNQFGNENFYIKHGTPYSFSYVLFTNLDGINSDLYLQETEKIKKEIQDYNSQINDIICKINLLKWEQYVVFEGVKYGIPEIVFRLNPQTGIYNNFHTQNDCNGLMELETHFLVRVVLVKIGMDVVVEGIHLIYVKYVILKFTKKTNHNTIGSLVGLDEILN